MQAKKTLLRQLRLARGLKLDEVALATGVDVAIVSKAERRVLRGRQHALQKLAEFYGVHVDDLLKDAVLHAEVADVA